MGKSITASVIMNSFNEREDWLKLAIESYLNQEKTIVQLIISTIEGDKNILLMKDYPVEIVITKKSEHPGKCPKGSFMQLNNALPFVKGKYFCFASSNDIAMPYKIITELQCCVEKQKDICYSAYYYMDEKGEITSTQLFHEYNNDMHHKGNFVADCSLISKRIIDLYLPFNLSLNNYAFWDLWLRVFEKEGNRFCYNSIPTWKYRQDKDAMHVKRTKSDKEIKQAQYDKERMLELHK